MEHRLHLFSQNSEVSGCRKVDWLFAPDGYDGNGTTRG